MANAWEHPVLVLANLSSLGTTFHSSRAKKFRARAEFARFSPVFRVRVSLPRTDPCASIRRERRAFQGIFRFSFASARSETQGPSQNRGQRTARSFDERRRALPPKWKIQSGASPRLKPGGGLSPRLLSESLKRDFL